MSASTTHPDALVRVDDLSRVGEARRAAALLASALGFDETLAGKVAIATTELATNLARHAKEGAIHLSVFDDELRVVALDRGPGIARVQDAMRDGHSTGGTPGSGLGAIKRLASTFDLHTVPNVGTTVLAAFRKDPSAAGVVVGTVNVPISGERLNGDAWFFRRSATRVLVALIDGLGHGPGAAEASNEALAIAERRADLAPNTLIEAMHEGMRGTRGAAVGVAELDLGKRVLRFAGVGNIAGTMLKDGVSRSVVSHGGIVGSECRRVQALEYPWAKGTLLVMASDGLQTQWKLDRYPGLALRHPALIAATLFRDWSRGRDDLTVFVLRES